MNRTYLNNFARTRRPKTAGSSSFATTRYIYAGLFGRSFREKVAAAMLKNRQLNASVVCIDSNCCPDGSSSMVDHWRQHALRSRARQLDEIRQMPDAAWRLNKIAT